VSVAPCAERKQGRNEAKVWHIDSDVLCAHKLGHNKRTHVQEHPAGGARAELHIALQIQWQQAALLLDACLSLATIKANRGPCLKQLALTQRNMANRQSNKDHLHHFLLCTSSICLL